MKKVTSKNAAEAPGRVSFRALILLNGKTATGIRVPPEVVESLGPGRRPAVRATINGYTYRSSVASMGGEYMLGVSAEVRDNAHVSAGDQVDIVLELDNEPRQVSVPPDFAAALDRDVQAGQFFNGLSYSNKRRIVLQIEAARAAETRRRRIEKAVRNLRMGKL